MAEKPCATPPRRRCTDAPSARPRARRRGQTGAQPRPSRARDELMAAKLKHAKLLLEGIALADFKKIQRSAEELIQLSKTAEWRAVQSPRYELYTNEFRRAGEDLVQKAGAK